MKSEAWVLAWLAKLRKGCNNLRTTSDPRWKLYTAKIVELEKVLEPSEEGVKE